MKDIPPKRPRVITAADLMAWRERGMAPLMPEIGTIEYNPPALEAVARRWLNAAEKLEEADRDFDRICREHGWRPEVSDPEP